MRRIYTPIPKKVVLPRPSPDYLIPVINLDGASYLSYADTDELNMGVGDFMIGVWVRTSKDYSASIGIVCSKYGVGVGANYRYELQFHSTNKFLFAIYGGSDVNAFSNAAQNDGRWHFYTAVYDKSSATGVTLSVDGVLQTDTGDASAQGSLDNDGIYYVGAQLGNQRYFYGDIALIEQWYLGYGGLPSDAADYALWRFRNPYADLSQFAAGAWSGYADADRSEQVANGDMEGGFTGGLADNWFKQGNDQIFADDVVVFHGGAHAQRITVTAAGEAQGAGVQQSISLVAGQVYEVSSWIYQSSTRNVSYYCSGFVSDLNNEVIPGTTWTRFTWIVEADATGSTVLIVYNSPANCSENDCIVIDDISVKRVGNVLKCDGEDDGTGKLKDDTSNDLDLIAYPGGNAGHYTKSKMLDYDYIPFKRYKR